MSKSRTLRATIGALGVMAMVWGITGGNVPVHADAGTDAASALSATGLLLGNSNGRAAALPPAGAALEQTILATPPGQSSDVQAQEVDDPDGDGATNEPPGADINGNGVPDGEDPTIAVFETVDGIVAVMIADPLDEELRNVSHDSATRSAGTVNLPYGLLAYDVIGADGQVEIFLLWEKKASGATTLFKGTSSEVSPHPSHEFFEDDLVIAWAYYLQDGGAGDADGAVNGTVKDPIGPGIQTATTTTTTTSTTAPGAPTTTTTTTTPGATTTTTPGATTTTSSTSSTSTTSTSTTSTTVVAPGDPDGDGMADEDGSADLDGDGRPDDRDPTVAAFTTPHGPVALVITESSGQFRKVAFSDVESVGNVATPNGLVSFDVVNVTGSVLIVAGWLRADSGPLALYKGSATALQPFAVEQDESTSEVFIVAYRITDGGSGDHDGQVNGVVVDPAGPGYDLGTARPTGTPTDDANSGVATPLARTGMSPLFPGAGITLVVVGALLVAVAARPNGRHFRRA